MLGDVMLEDGYSYQRIGHEVRIKNSQGKVVVKNVMIHVSPERLKSFMDSLTLDQLKGMFK